MTAQIGNAVQPHEVIPQLATAGGRLEAGTWLFERKLDGIRCLIYLDGDGVRLQSRNGKPGGSSSGRLVLAWPLVSCSSTV
ncbi:MAG: hypothetical protein WD360_00060 [Nitriliruptoraceae bacterium]